MLKDSLEILTGLLIIFVLCLPLQAQEQKDFNLEFVGLGSIEFADNIGSSFRSYNDVWGWVSSEGIEYGIIGSGVGTSIFSLEDPAQPELITTIPGSLSIWRDIKSYGDYLYVVADQGNDGLLIIDMQMAPDSISYSFWKPDLVVHGDSTTLGTCHNLYIDSSFIYLAGCDGTAASRGVLIFDLSETPLEPQYISATDPVYAHDVFVNGSRLYASNLGNGFSIVDISDPAQPLTLAFQETSRDFTHNAWSSGDNQFLFTTDERSNAFVDAYRVDNADDIELLDQYRPYASLGLGTIPHNVHFHNHYLVISYYTDGVKIVDAHDPTNLVEVGSYDTYFDRDGTFGGAWGAYPYLPSGLVLASDRSRGLFVLQPNYVRAAYIEGVVIDSLSEAPLENVEITFRSDLPGYAVTDASGIFSTGLADQGAREIEVFKPGYERKFLEVELFPGTVDTLLISLKPLSRYQIMGQVIEDETGNPVAGASVFVQNDDYEEFTTTDNAGAFLINSYEGTFTIAAGKWGYVHSFKSLKVEGEVTDQTLTLEQGYRDDFIFDYGWQVESSSRVGDGQEWLRGTPGYAVYDGELAGPYGDIDGDLGNSCYVTGLASSLGANLTDTSTLISPIFDLADYQDPYINYHLWFNDVGVSPPDDELHVYLCSEQGETLIERVMDPASAWRDRSEIRISDFQSPGDNMFLKFVAADTGNVHIYKAALDAFSITEGLTTSSKQAETSIKPLIYPNPCLDEIWIDRKDMEIDSYIITDTHGSVRRRGEISTSNHHVQLSVLPAGIYFLSTFEHNHLRSTDKVIILQ